MFLVKKGTRVRLGLHNEDHTEPYKTKKECLFGESRGFQVE